MLINLSKGKSFKVFLLIPTSLKVHAKRFRENFPKERVTYFCIKWLPHHATNYVKSTFLSFFHTLNLEKSFYSNFQGQSRPVKGEPVPQPTTTPCTTTPKPCPTTTTTTTPPPCPLVKTTTPKPLSPCEKARLAQQMRANPYVMMADQPDIGMWHIVKL